MQVVTTIFDKLSGTYGPLTTSPNVDTAKRNVSYAFTADPMLSSNLKDFELHILGSFDPVKCSLVSFDKPDVYPLIDFVGGDKIG